MKAVYVFAALLLALTSCNNATVEKKDKSSGAASRASVTHSLQLEGTDGIELFFYPNPEDRKIYQQLSLADKSLIAALCLNFLQDTMARTECPHDVKMYLLRKGEVYKTIYGATADSCRYFAYAINSRPFFTPMQKRSFTLLDSLRRAAK